MAERLVLDYVASRDGVPAFYRGGVPFRREGLLPLDDAKRPFRWAAGGRTPQTMPNIRPVVPRRPGQDPRCGGQAQTVTFNADAMDMLDLWGLGLFGYDPANKALTLHNRPLSADLWDRMGEGSNREQGKLYVGAEMHTGMHGVRSWHEATVRARIGGNRAVWTGFMWAMGIGDPDIPEDPYAELDWETVNGRPSPFSCGYICNQPLLDSKGRPRIGANNSPLWGGGNTTRPHAWVDAIPRGALDEFHDYGWRVLPDVTEWLFDGRVVFSCPTPPVVTYQLTQPVEGGLTLIFDAKVANESNGAWGKGRTPVDADHHTLSIQSIRVVEGIA